MDIGLKNQLEDMVSGNHGVLLVEHIAELAELKAIDISRIAPIVGPRWMK